MISILINGLTFIDENASTVKVGLDLMIVQHKQIKALHVHRKKY